MRESVRLGRVAGIPIGVHWSILGVAVYLVAALTLGALPRWFPSTTTTARLTVSGVATLLFFLSILGHELGHALAARRHGIDVDGISLWLLGGIARLRQQASTPKAEFDVAAAGPAASLALSGGFAVASLGIDRFSDWRLAAAACGWLSISNLLLGLSNLFPVAPLDGGRVLTAYLWRRSGDAEEARLLSARAGLVFGTSLAVVFSFGFVFTDRVGLWWAVLGAGTGLFLVHAAIDEIAGAVIRRRLTAVTTGSLMASHPPPVPDSMSAGEFLQWSTTRGGPTACPVVRWDHEPIGYIDPGVVAALSPGEQSWTTVAQLMTTTASAARAWETEPIGAVLDRFGESQHRLIVIHDPHSGLPTGTLTRPQIDPLFTRPNLWGVSKSAPPPPAATQQVLLN